MATREEKVQIIEELKTQIDLARQELEALLRRRRRRQLAGSLFRFGILLLVMSIGVGIAAYLID